jgi:hypothetical protein
MMLQLLLMNRRQMMLPLLPMNHHRHRHQMMLPLLPMNHHRHRHQMMLPLLPMNHHRHRHCGHRCGHHSSHHHPSRHGHHYVRRHRHLMPRLQLLPSHLLLPLRQLHHRLLPPLPPHLQLLLLLPLLNRSHPHLRVRHRLQKRVEEPPKVQVLVHLMLVKPLLLTLTLISYLYRKKLYII